jgi:hypothetical protein
VVLAEKPLISEETDLIEPTLLDELICHISSLASVYHKPPNAFVEGRGGVPARKVLPPRTGSITPEDPAQTEVPSVPQATVIPGADSLIGDLLDMDLGPPSQSYGHQPPPMQSTSVDLLGEGLDSLVRSSKFAGYT